MWDKKDHCVYCKTDVSNFTRHLLRKHSNEVEVAKYASLMKGSEERKSLAEEILNLGNFFKNVEG